MLIYDTTGIESYVAENNPKYLGKMAAQSKPIAKIDPTFDPSRGAAALLPKAAASNPAIKQQYINGHFCYAQKASVIANGLGNRSPRLKHICSSKYGRCVYVHQNKNLRLYPGIARDSLEFSKTYNCRTAVERSINTLKVTLGIANRKTSNTLSTKADLFLAGIVQLLCIVLAHKLHDKNLARRPRKLIAA